MKGKQFDETEYPVTVASHSKGLGFDPVSLLDQLVMHHAHSRGV